MKKLFVLLGIICSTLAANAQFSLTPNELRDTNNLDNDYILVEAKDKTAAELYSTTLYYLWQNSNSAKDLTSNVEDKIITLYAIIPNAVDRTKVQTEWDL